MSPLLLGHRGSPHEYPENTIPSYQAALDVGLDGWRVNTWTVNATVEVQRLMNLGVYAIIGNHPGILLTARS